MSQFYDLNIQGSEVQLRLDLASHNVLAFDGILEVPVVASDALITEAGTYQIVYAPNGGRGEMLLSMGGVYYRHFKLQSEGKTVLDSSWYNTDGQIRRDRLFLNGAARDIYAYAAGAFGKVERDGVDGITPHIDTVTRHWMIGETDTGILARGTDGESAYQTAVNEGYQGTPSEWIASLHGLNGKSAYELWVEQPGNEGKTLNEFLASLKESGYKMQAVTVRPSTIAGIEADKIYLYPDGTGQFSTAIYTGDLESSYDSTKWVVLATNPGDLSGAFTDINGLRTDVNNLSALVGCYVCATAAATAAKTVSATGYTLTTGGNIRIKMEHANTATSGVTLQIGSAAAQTLYYNGEEVSDENTWEDNEVIIVYYDGTSYCATNSLGGGEGLKKAGITITETDGGNNLLNPYDERENGLLNSDGSLNVSNSYYTSFWTTGLIPIDNTSYYTLYGSSSGKMAAVCFYDSTETFISKLPGGYANSLRPSYDIPDNAKYIRVSDLFTSEEIGVFKGQDTPYSDFYYQKHTEYKTECDFEEKTSDEILTKRDIEPMVADVESIGNKLQGIGDNELKGLTSLLQYNESISTNLINPDNFMEGCVVNGGGVDTAPQTPWRTTEYIPIDTSKSYTLYGSNDGAMKYIAFYKADKSIIGPTRAAISSLIPSDYPNLAVYIRCSDNSPATMGMFEGESVPFESYYHNESVTYNGATYSKKGTNDILVKKDVSESIDYTEKLMTVMEYKEDISTNLLNPANPTSGGLDNAGAINTDGANIYAVTSDFIKIDADTTYTFVNIRGLHFYDSNHAHISGYKPAEAEDIIVRTAPSGSSFVRVFAGQLVTGGIFATDSYTDDDYEPYYNRKWIDYKGQSGGGDTQDLTLGKVGGNYNVTYGDITVRCTLDKTPNDLYGGSHCFNFLGASWAGNSYSTGDDVPAIHLRGTIVTANHNYPRFTVRINGHGLTNNNLGGLMESATGGFVHVIMRIVDADHIVLVNKQTSNDDYVTAHEPISPLTYNGSTYTIAQKANNQYDIAADWLFPSINVTKRIVIDGVVQDSNVSDAHGKTIDFVESYDLMDVKDIQDNLTSDGTYNGRSIVHRDNIYRFTDDCTCLIISNIVFTAINARFPYTGFAMAERINGANPISELKYYVPASRDIFATPAYYNLLVPARQSFYPVEGKTISRVIEIYNNAIFVIGILPVGVGTNIPIPSLVISESGKVLPRHIDYTSINPDGVPTEVGESYSAVTYRKHLDVRTQKAGRICMYRINHDGVAYIYIDYSQSIFDHVELDDASLNGKTIEVVEQMNAELKTTIYNDGFYVLASPVTGESCYCIVKIKL